MTSFISADRGSHHAHLCLTFISAPVTFISAPRYTMTGELFPRPPLDGKVQRALAHGKAQQMRALGTSLYFTFWRCSPSAGSFNCRVNAWLSRSYTYSSPECVSKKTKSLVVAENCS